MKLLKYIFCLLLVFGLTIPLIQYAPEINPQNPIIAEHPFEIFDLLTDADASSRRLGWGTENEQELR